MVQITEVIDDGRRAVIAPAALDNQREVGLGGAYLYLRTRPKGTTKAVYGNTLNGSTLREALGRIAAKSTDPDIQRLAKLLQAHDAIAERTGKIRTADIHAFGRIDYQGNIELRNDLTAYETEHTLLHEALHRFTARPFSIGSSERTPQEQRFVDTIQQAFEQARTADPFGMRDIPNADVYKRQVYCGTM